MKRTNKVCYIGFMLWCWLLAGCSTTKNLPEEEVLYTGISSIDYGEKSKKERQKEKEEGVITSFAGAYKAIDELLTQKEISALKKEKELTAEQQDSLKAVQRIEEEAYNTAKEEVNAALAYAPNNAFFGSSSLKWPFPIGLWIYNDFIHAEKKVGKWIFERFAAKPVFISSVNPELRAKVSENLLHDYGYFNGTYN